MHDRHMSTGLDVRASTIEVFHRYHGVAGFTSKLSGPIKPSERDALWATTALVGVITFCHIEATAPEEAWPLKPPSVMDLNWLRMSEGKKEIWKIAQPSRADSVFRPLTTPEDADRPPTLAIPTTAPVSLEVLPSEFIRICALESSMPDPNRNPYYDAAFALAQVLNTDDYLSVVLRFLSFISHIPSGYKRLLECKDPAALLLLGWWYAKVCRYPLWWIWRRAALEGQAICMYLERYHGHDADIQTLLQFPRTACGTALAG